MNPSGYSVNKLGAYLSDTAVRYTTLGSVLNYTPQVISTVFLNDTLNWMNVSGYYHAIGGEKFITIGDFKPFNMGDTLNVLSGGWSAAYYLIDDVSITKVAGCDTTAGINEINTVSLFNIYPNPNDGNMTLKYTLKQSDQASVKLYDVTGKLVEEYLLNSNESQKCTSS